MIPRWALGIMGVVVLGLLLVAWEYKGKSTATARDNLQDASLRAEIARLRQRLHALNASSSGKPDAAQSDGEFGDFVHSLLRDRGLNDSEATVAVSLLGAAKIRSSKALLHANLRDLHLPPRALAALNASRVELELALTPSSLTRLESELAAATSQLKLTQQQLAATADNLAATSDSLASAVSQLNRTQRLLSSASQNLTQCRAQAAQAAQASTCAATGADVPFRFAIPTKLLYIQGDLGGGYGNVFTGVRAALFLGRCVCVCWLLVLSSCCCWRRLIFDSCRLLNRTVIFTKPNDYRVKTVFESLDTSRSHQGGVFLLDAQTTPVIRAAYARDCLSLLPCPRVSCGGLLPATQPCVLLSAGLAGFDVKRTLLSLPLCHRGVWRVLRAAHLCVLLCGLAGFDVKRTGWPAAEGSRAPAGARGWTR